MSIRSLGAYRVKGLVGRGGMAEVYLGQQVGAGGFARDVCLKVLRPELAADPGFVEMFTGEARVTAMMQHPNIVQVFDCGEQNGLHYLVMEYVSGVSLQRILDDVRARGYRLPLEFSIHVMEGLLLALRYAHTATCTDSHGPLVHRDISPHNVLISSRGVVKLTDFGIAKMPDFTPETAAGVLKGKLSYMSPEQLRREKLSPLSDLFSAGALFYELLTSRRLFRRGEQTEVPQQILQWQPREIKGLSRSVNQLLSRMLQKDPSERIRNADAALTGLQELGIPVCSAEQVSRLVQAVMGDEAPPVDVLPAELPRRASQPDAETRVSEIPTPGLTPQGGRDTCQIDD